MLSVYDAKGEYINGILPDDFPIDHPFMKTEIQEVGNDIDSWYVYDKVMIWEDGQVYWIRGINTYSAITHLVETLTKWILLIFPILVFFTAFMGYRMISKSLKPVQEMAATVNEIKKSSDLSLRIPEHETKDELAYLANTFNDLLATTEDQIQREKQFSSDAPRLAGSLASPRNRPHPPLASRDFYLHWLLTLLPHYYFSHTTVSPS